MKRLAAGLMVLGIAAGAEARGLERDRGDEAFAAELRSAGARIAEGARALAARQVAPEACEGPRRRSSGPDFQRTVHWLYEGMRPGFAADFERKLDFVFGMNARSSPTVANYGILGVLLKHALKRYDARLTYGEKHRLSVAQFEFEWIARTHGWSYAGTDSLPPGLEDSFPSLEWPPDLSR